jgi:hypothetical protein
MLRYRRKTADYDEQKGQAMKQRLYGIKVLATILAMLAVSGAANAGKLEPFKGTSRGVVTNVGFDPANGIAYAHGSGEGEATHLGRFTTTGDVSVDLATGIVLGTYTLTAANGDMLFLTMRGHGISPVQGSGSFIILGGTGRFQGATGYYESIITFAGPMAPVVPYFDVFEGAISFGSH